MNVFVNLILGMNENMKTEIADVEASVPRSPPSKIRLAPSLRVPVTPGNRELLRSLRAAELAAWEASFVSAHENSAATPLRLQQHQI
jgi:hypothetical protein